MTPESDDSAGEVRRALEHSFDRATRPPLLGLVAAVTLALLVSVSARHLLTLDAPHGGNIQAGTGDFLAFWTGAVALHEGDGARLYDFQFQRDLQERILGGPTPSFQPYLNPPLLALLLQAAVPLGYVRAFLAYDAFCIAALVAGIAMLARMLPALASDRRSTWTLGLLVAACQPMFLTTVGGQNTPLTFSLLAAFSFALSRSSETGAAVALGLLTYKPQYAIGLGLALAMAGRWRVALGGAALGLVHALAGAWWCGWTWPRDMLAFFALYRPLELRDNAWTHFSWVRTTDAMLPTPVDSAAAAVGVALVLAVWWRLRELGRRGDPLWCAVVVCGTMLASPHLQYYDVALLVLPVAVALDRVLAEGRMPSLTTRVALAASYVAYPVWRAAPSLGFQPLFVVLLGVTLAVTALSLRQPERN